MLSLIIPTLNAATQLDDLLTQIERSLSSCATDFSIDDIIVCDGGSTDGTVAIALSHGVRLALGARGRGSQLARGVRLAVQSGGPREDAPHWLLILHADSQLPDRWWRAVQTHMTEHQKTGHQGTAGYFKFGLTDTGWRPRLMERIVALRCALWKMPYGDQGLLIERTLYEASGGYPHWPLFEDVKLIEGLAGRIRPLGPTLYTSGEKYREHGYGRRAWANFKLYRRYQKGTPIDELAQKYASQK